VEKLGGWDGVGNQARNSEGLGFRKPTLCKRRKGWGTPSTSALGKHESQDLRPLEFGMPTLCEGRKGWGTRRRRRFGENQSQNLSRWDFGMPTLCEGRKGWGTRIFRARNFLVSSGREGVGCGLSECAADRNFRSAWADEGVRPYTSGCRADLGVRPYTSGFGTDLGVRWYTWIFGCWACRARCWWVCLYVGGEWGPAFLFGDGVGFGVGKAVVVGHHLGSVSG